MKKQVALPLVLDESVKSDITCFVYNSDTSLWEFNSNDNLKRRYFCNLSKHNELKLSKQVTALRKKIFEWLKITNYRDEYKFGNFIGVNRDGANVNFHKDKPDNDGWIHVRVNCLVQKPKLGGMPVIDGIEYNIQEGQCWLNNATEWLHGSTPVQGLRDRIVLSLGAYVSPNTNIFYNE